MNRPPFRLHHIALLNVVMNSKTLTEAARRLHVSQPAVSKQLKQLQSDLGFPLFDRAGHRLTPTFEARAMLDQVGRVNASLDVLNRLAGEVRSARRGHLQVGCVHAAALHLLPKALQATIGNEGEMLCSVHSGNTAQLLELIETQQLDLAVALKVRDTSRLSYVPLMPVRLTCLIPRDHVLADRRVLSPKDLRSQMLIGIDLPEAVWTGAGSPKWDDGLSSVRVRVDSAQIACNMVEAGLGIAVVDSLTSMSALNGTLLRKPLRHPYEAELGIYRPTFRPRTGFADDLIDVLHLHAAKIGKI